VKERDAGDGDTSVGELLNALVTLIGEGGLAEPAMQVGGGVSLQ